jgi:dethiobiotin synthetase
MRTVVITGTDTGIGKTRVAGFIARLLSQGGRVQVVKPVECGAGAGRPADAPAAAGDWAEPHTLIALAEPLAPLAAAAKAGVELSLARLVQATEALPDCDWRVIETAGGIAVPVDASGTDWADYAKGVKADHLVCVVDNRLGAINQSRLIAAYCLMKTIASAGIWLNAARSNPPAAVLAANREGLAHCSLPLWGESAFAAKTPPRVNAAWLRAEREMKGVKKGVNL